MSKNTEAMLTIFDKKINYANYNYILIINIDQN